jgi:ATP-dependent DNA helicase RecG
MSKSGKPSMDYDLVENNNTFSDIPIAACYGVGATIAKKFYKLNIFTARDLLMHFPRSYENRSQITPFEALQIDMKCLCQGVIVSSGLEGRRRNILRVMLKQHSKSEHFLLLKFFHFSPKQANQFRYGQEIRCFGTVKAGMNALEMIHPEIEFISEKSNSLADYLIATYPSSDGLPQFRIRNAINPLLNQLAAEPFGMDSFQSLLASHSAHQELSKISYLQAIYTIHRPPLDSNFEDLERGKTPYFERLSIEELTAHRLGLKRLHSSFGQYQALPIPLSVKSDLQHQLLQKLPFEPTSAQQKCYAEIAQAMQNSKPMMHLLQGDVGSGKTLVAILVMLGVVEQGYKAALMVPTELLAQQHYHTLTQWLNPLGIKVHLLCGKKTVKQRREIHQNFISDEPCIAVGTHALFQEKVEITRLAIIIIDEQHRFGVQQRFELLQKSQQENQENVIAHQLLISATPIPRTLAMSMYGDLQQSTLDEMPAGRQDIETYVMSNTQVNQLSQRIGEQCAESRQVYWVCPFIDESEILNVQSAIGRYEQLQEMLPNITIGLMHGRLKEAEKQEIMEKFRTGEIQLLVATTVIEVGVDVPNASIIIIENAERMGLAQLHQLRGRVGRGTIKSQCILLYQAPLGEQGYRRLNALKSSNDGFHLAERDLQMRGAGEIIGIRQSGSVHFKIADMIRDQHLISAVNQLSEIIVTEKKNELEERLLNRWSFTRSELGKV